MGDQAPGTVLFAEVLPSDPPEEREALEYLDRATVLFGLLLLRRMLHDCQYPDDVKVGLLDHLNGFIANLRERTVVVRGEGRDKWR